MKSHVCIAVVAAVAIAACRHLPFEVSVRLVQLSPASRPPALPSGQQPGSGATDDACRVAAHLLVVDGAVDDGGVWSVAVGVRGGLAAHGVRVVVTTCARLRRCLEQAGELGPHVVVVGYYPGVDDDGDRGATDLAALLPPTVVLYNPVPLPNVVSRAFASVAQRGTVWDVNTNPEHANALKWSVLGVQPLPMPVGYHPAMHTGAGHKHPVPDAAKTVDVLMMGTQSPYRLQVATALRAANVSVAWGSVRGSVDDARVVLVLPQDAAADDHFHVATCVHLLANAAFVIAEARGVPSDTRPVADYVVTVASSGAVLPAVRRFLDNPFMREAIAADGVAWVAGDTASHMATAVAPRVRQWRDHAACAS